MTTSAPERIRELTQRMLRKKLYVVFSKASVSPDRLTPHLPDHLEYMIALEREGMLFASGPLTDEGKEPHGDGMTILRTANLAEARAIAERDPFYVNGLRAFEIKEWTLMEGSLQVRVNFSDQSVEVG
jgi:uncharacterized protein YciI